MATTFTPDSALAPARAPSPRWGLFLYPIVLGPGPRSGAEARPYLKGGT